MLGAQLSAFYKNIAEKKEMWVIRTGEESCLKWINEDGSEILPVWSTESRAKKIIKMISGTKEMKPLCITEKEFYSKWIDELRNNNIAVGPNWAGDNITGTSLPVDVVVSGIEAVKKNNE